MKPGRPTTEPGTFEFRPRSGRLVGIGWAIVAAAWIVVAARDGWSTAIASIPIICLTSVAVYALFIRPKVCVGPTKVVLVNVIRDVTIPLQILARVDTQYALTLTTTDGKRYQAWAAPAGGRLGAARMTEEERRSLTWSGPEQDIPSSAALRSDAGAAAAAIRRTMGSATQS